MKVQDLRDRPADELSSEVQKALAAQFKLRVQKATGQLTQTHLLKQARRDIARLKTVLSEKAGK